MSAKLVMESPDDIMCWLIEEAARRGTKEAKEIAVTVVRACSGRGGLDYHPGDFGDATIRAMVLLGLARPTGTGEGLALEFAFFDYKLPEERPAGEPAPETSPVLDVTTVYSDGIYVQDLVGMWAPHLAAMTPEEQCRHFNGDGARARDEQDGVWFEYQMHPATMLGWRGEIHEIAQRPLPFQFDGVFFHAREGMPTDQVWLVRREEGAAAQMSISQILAVLQVRPQA